VANSILVYSLLALAYLVTPAALIVGWVRWSRRTDSRTPATTASLISFALASSSAALAAITLVVAQFHHFGFYDPILMRIYRSGAVLSCLSALLALIGLWRRNSLRWYAPACAVGTLAFWIMAAAGE
jgi:peptidoglycan/LPS O-acetylase OafA/YrhL